MLRTSIQVKLKSKKLMHASVLKHIGNASRSQIRYIKNGLNRIHTKGQKDAKGASYLCIKRWSMDTECIVPTNLQLPYGIMIHDLLLMVAESSYPLLIDFLLETELAGIQEATCYKCKEKGGVRFRHDAYADFRVVLTKKGTANLEFDSTATMDELQAIECFTCNESLHEKELLKFNKLGSIY